MKGKLYNSEAYFTETKIDQLGFREYDARWIIEPSDSEDVQINYRGLLQLGNWLGRFLRLPANGEHDSIIIGHDFRKYAENAKNALALGLLSSGMRVFDVGLCLSPVLYYAQHEYAIASCAMVTASHNPNGWSGVKMGHDYSLTFGSAEMQAFKDFAHESGFGIFSAETAGHYSQIHDAVDRYKKKLLNDWTVQLRDLPRLKVVVETGNGTAGIVLPDLLASLSFDVVAGYVEPDWDFPHFNPNPESVPFLRHVQDLVCSKKAEIGICVDGDGDRIGFVDDTGKIVFSDRAALLIAKRLEALQGAGTFVVDVKSTALFNSQLKSKVIWEKTGHSYIKATVAREQALAGFERSGHFFFNEPFGLGYDDACLAALIFLWLLCEAKAEGKRLSDVLKDFPLSRQSPNRQPVVPERVKYSVVEEIAGRIKKEFEDHGTFAGMTVKNVLTINGVRVHYADGSWFLIRASSNTPNLVILAESFDQEDQQLRKMDQAIRNLLTEFDDVGPFEPLYET